MTIGEAEGLFFFNGLLDEISIYNRALADTEVAQLAYSAIPDLSPVLVAGGATLDLNGNTEMIGPLSGAGNVALGTGTLKVNLVFDGDDNAREAVAVRLERSSKLERITLQIELELRGKG